MSTEFTLDFVRLEYSSAARGGRPRRGIVVARVASPSASTTSASRVPQEARRTIAAALNRSLERRASKPSP